MLKMMRATTISSSLNVGYGIASRLRGCTPYARRNASNASSAFLAKLKHYSAVISLNDQMGLLGIGPDAYTLNIIINCFSQLNQMGFGLSVLGKFFKLVIPNVVIYTTLMDGFCKVGRTQDAQKLFSQMQACGHFPDIQTYAVLLDGLCKNQQFPEAIQLLRDMESKKLEPNIVIYAILIGGLCIGGKVESARDLFRNLSSRGLQPNTRTYNIMIGGLCNGGLTNEAVKLLNEMEEKGCSPNGCTYNIIIRGFFNNNEPSEAMGLIQQMVGKDLKGVASFLDTNCFAGDEIQQTMLPGDDVLSWTLM
ncbi:unnamed protein product [Malus baccata var. baccata]